MNAPRVRRTVAILLALAAAALATFGLAVVWGLAVEYGASPELLPPVVALPTGLAVLAVACWPRIAGRTVLATAVVVALLLLASAVAANWLGGREHDRRAVQASESFACNGPNSELRVDPRVDEVFAELPRPARLYGPVEGTRAGCTAAVAGDESFEAWAAELRDLDGWEVQQDQPRRVVVRRADGVTITLLRRVPTLLRVEAGPAA